jgi:hypothetical protein
MTPRVAPTHDSLRSLCVPPASYGYLSAKPKTTRTQASPAMTLMPAF